MGDKQQLPPPWVIVAASLVCLCVGSTPVSVFATGLLVGPVSAEFGWSHAQFFGMRMIGTIVGAAAAPLLGAWADRVGVRRLLLPGILVYALANASLALLNGSLASYLGLCLVIGVVSFFQSPPLYIKAISMRTDRNRGAATSIAMAGTGVGTAILMPIVAILIAKYGWRSAPVGLSIIMAAVAIPTVFFFIREPARTEPTGETKIEMREGMTAAQVLRSKTFWLLALIFVIGGTAINGIFVNMPSMLKDRHINAAMAASALSSLALAQIVGRVGSGALLDRIRTPKIGILWFALAMIGIAAVGQAQTMTMATLGAVFIGVGLGAELELAAYYTARFFGLRHFARLYGLLYSAFVVGTGVGPTIVGRIFDVTGGYDIASWGAVGLLGIDCLLVLLLGPYVFLPVPRVEQRIETSGAVGAAR